MSNAADQLGHIRPWRHIERRKSRQIRVGSVAVGGDAPISVQSMKKHGPPPCGMNRVGIFVEEAVIFYSRC